MEPIISPWLIWIISILSDIDRFCQCFSLVSLILSVTTYAMYKVGEVELIQSSKPSLVFMLMFIILSIIQMIIPDKQIMLTMLTLQYITPDNIILAQDSIVELIEKIIRAYKEVE